MESLNKIVFLIDTDTGTDEGQIRSICLSCLRTLMSLSSTTGKAGTTRKSRISQTNVKWGYKFYNSRSVKTKVEFHKFYDFKLKYFEEFEHAVERRFDGKVTTSTVAPAVCLKKALTEVLSDFPWEGPDITSPVKGRKAHKHVTRSKNHIYMFSNCPRTNAELKQFSGKKVPDGDVFLDSILPPSLYQEFCYTSKLSLNWIDTYGLSTKLNEQTADLCAVRIVESAVYKAGGHVFPIGGIVQNGSPYYVDVESLMLGEGQDASAIPARDPVHSQSHLLPLSTTLEHLQNTPADSTFSGSDTVLTIGSSVIHLDMVPSAKHSTDRRFHEPLAEETDLLTTTPGYVDRANTGPPSTLRAYSLLDRAACRSLLPDTCYIGSQAERDRIWKHSANSEKNGTFRDVLSSLASKACSLILVCGSTGQLIVLEPLTIDTACVYPLSHKTTLAMEKVLIHQNTQLSTPQTGTSGDCDCSDGLVQKLLNGKRLGSNNAVSCVPVSVCGRLDGKLMDRWHIPGPKSSFKSLIHKLNLRINELEFLNRDETNVLKQLQKAYKLEKKPPGVRDTSMITASNAKDETDDSKAEDRFELPMKGKASRTSISRAEMILSKSKEVVKVRDTSEKEGTEKTKLGREKSVVITPQADFQSVDELKEFLTSTYERAISGESTCVDMNVQTTVTVALHYLKQSGRENPEDECSQVLNDCVVLSASGLREKYSSNMDVSTEQKMAEYQFQIVLRLEMLSTLISKDQTIGEEDSNDEVVGMLRTLSFMCESGALSKFMETCLLYNYMHTIPKTLANIYDELMQPLPGALANILSPNNSSADQSVFNSSLVDGEVGPPSARTRSHGSVGPPSSQPGSNTLDSSINKPRGGRKLVHHPSLAGFGAQRQIVVEKVPKPKEKSSRKRRRSGKEGKDIVVKSLFDKSSRGGTKLERRQSVAVMQRTQKTPKKTATRLLFKSPVHNSPRRKSLVAETPQRKQLSKSLCQYNDDVSESQSTDIVEESPEKTYHGDRKDTPTKGKRAKALMRRSFYSAGPLKRTKNLTQYFQLADRIAGRLRHPSNPTQNKLPKLLSLESDKQFKSPEKNSSFLLSQLVFSPSPNKRTPKKLNQTPSKLLIDSPSRNTRSRHLSGCAAPANSFNLFDSPKRKSSLQEKVASPSRHLLQSPLSRRQSPRVLVQESSTKNEHVSPNKTPLKSPYCGTISTGLDSPGDGPPHIKLSATPTRRSVRAALFSKSPAPNRTFSPRAANASPRSLISRFGSPRKQVTNDILLSPKRQWRKTGDDNTSVLGQYNLTGNRQTITSVDEAKKSEPLLHTGEDKCVDDKKTVIEGVQKTPSPHEKKAKTPESFDRWRRRKPRNQVSPAPQKEPSTIITQELSSPRKSSSLLTSQETQSPRRKKRYLIMSPDRPAESPSKRRRTSRLDSLGALGTGSQLNSTMIKDGSQGFDVGSPLTVSQLSSASSLDYFTAANDEVFLSASQTKSQIQPPLELEDMEVDNIENVRLRRVKSRDKGESLFKKRTFERLGSSSFPCSGESERSESPIFLTSSVNSGRKRHLSNSKFIPIIEDTDNGHKPTAALTNNSASNSPNFGLSPNEKKYSPSVSAKSLMHLINSPLMNAADKSEARSRRSLRLQN